MGMGRVSMNIPDSAVNPPMSFPKNVCGLRSYPTVVMVIRPHQKDSTKVHELILPLVWEFFERRSMTY